MEGMNQKSNEIAEPVQLLKAEAACVVVVNLVDGMLQHLPCPFGVLGIDLHPVLERFDLEGPPLLRAHPRRGGLP